VIHVSTLLAASADPRLAVTEALLAASADPGIAPTEALR
jgi:hypothetical protein